MAFERTARSDGFDLGYKFRISDEGSMDSTCEVCKFRISDVCKFQMGDVFGVAATGGLPLLECEPGESADGPVGVLDSTMSLEDGCSLH